LAASWRSYEIRPEQTTMALAVARALDEGRLAVIEAGTGTGKTLAYLLPALLSGKKTIVSTGLKNLQDQIFYKDLVFIKRHFGDGFRPVLVKGRENYLCRRKLLTLVGKPDLLRGEEKKAAVAELVEWSDSTRSGELSELPSHLGEHFGGQGRLASPAETCRGPKCRFYEDCFWAKNRREAHAADLVLVNHHLFMADLAFRSHGRGVLPDWEAAIFDEAHLLENVATEWFGRRLETWRLRRLGRELVEAVEGDPEFASLTEQALFFDNQQDLLATFFERGEGEALLYPPGGADNQRIKDALLSLAELAASFNGAFSILGGEDDDKDDPRADLFGLLSARLRDTADAASFLAEASDPNYVYQVDKIRRQERDFQSDTLAALPIRVGNLLGAKLLETQKPVVLTSATLSVGGDFAFLKQRLGLGQDALTLTLPSPYDYRGRTLLYVPSRLPAPNQPGFTEGFLAEAEKILRWSQGRALLLFTSYRMLKIAADAFRGRLPWTVLVQGQASRTTLLNQFASDVHSVLLGAQSFWQGVDVPGESLSTVIIDRLPFPRPHTPLVDARCDLIDAEGGRSFMDYMVPEMTLGLRQGLGRLLRAATDKGLLAVMDSRLHTSRYKNVVFQSLPPAPLTTELNQVAEFLKTI
jgi:ATP-dependent DNA helicase DinG